jgi:hypothetical protein
MIEFDENYLQMQRDYDELEAQSVADHEELRKLRAGEIIVVPNDLEHARAMFKIACFYLTQYDTEFTLEMTK